MEHNTSKHEQKVCARCLRDFTCKVGDIANCQCSTVRLSEAAQKHIGTKYNDCLCCHCMKDEQHEYALREFNDKLKHVLRVNRPESSLDL